MMQQERGLVHEDALEEEHSSSHSLGHDAVEVDLHDVDVESSTAAPSVASSSSASASSSRRSGAAPAYDSTLAEPSHAGAGAVAASSLEDEAERRSRTAFPSHSNEADLPFGARAPALPAGDPAAAAPAAHPAHRPGVGESIAALNERASKLGRTPPPPYPEYQVWGQKKAKGIKGKTVWAGLKVFGALEFMGEVFADFLGLYDSKYQYVVDAYERNAREVALERAERQEARREAREEARAEELARQPARAREERDRQAHWAPPHASSSSSSSSSSQQVQPSQAASAAAASSSPITPSQDLPLLPSSPSASLSSSPPSSSASSPSLKVLFLCTGNSCRSILSEAMFNRLAAAAASSGGRFVAVSAGSHPRAQGVLPRTLQTLREAGFTPSEIAELRSKTMAEACVASSAPDIVISVCDKAAAEPCPVYFGPALRAHWGLHDPSEIEGADEQIHQAFHATLNKIQQRCQAFLALPFEQLDQAALKTELNRIGNL